MLAARKRKRTQRMLLLTTVGLLLYFLFVYQPLSRRAADLDQPLLNLWKELTEASAQVTGPDNAQLPKIDAALERVQGARNVLQRAREALLARIRPGPELKRRIDDTFQLIEFQNERQLATEQIWRLARQHKVQLDPGLAGGFPEYLADRRQPALLWAQQHLLQDVLTAAVLNEVSLVKSVSSPVIEEYAFAPTGRERLAEVPIQIEVVGNATAILRFLESLPLRADELQERGLPEVSPDKAAYFIDALFLRKETRDKVDEVRLRARVSSFVEFNAG